MCVNMKTITAHCDVLKLLYCVTGIGVPHFKVSFTTSLVKVLLERGNLISLLLMTGFSKMTNTVILPFCSLHIHHKNEKNNKLVLYV